MISISAKKQKNTPKFDSMLEYREWKISQKTKLKPKNIKNKLKKNKFLLNSIKLSKAFYRKLKLAKLRFKIKNITFEKIIADFQREYDFDFENSKKYTSKILIIAHKDFNSLSVIDQEILNLTLIGEIS